MIKISDQENGHYFTQEYMNAHFRVNRTILVVRQNLLQRKEIQVPKMKMRTMIKKMRVPILTGVALDTKSKLN